MEYHRVHMLDDVWVVRRCTVWNT